MNWKRILNPWGEIRRLELANAALEQKREDLWERANSAEDKAFHRASEHYYQRNRQIEAQLEYTQSKMVEIANLSPPSIIANMHGIAAAEGGEPQPSGSSPGFNGIF